MTFGCELERPRADGTCLVYLRLYHRGLMRRSLKFHVLPEHFKGGQVSKADPLHREKNLVIQKALLRAQSLHLEHRGWSARQIMEALDGAPVVNMEFYPLARARLDMLRQKLAYNTRLSRSSVLRVVERIKPDLLMSDFTPRLLEEIELALLDSGVTKNTVATKMKKLSATWVDLCKYHGLELPNPWDKYAIKFEESKVRGFLPEQVARIEAVDISGHSAAVQFDRDCFCLIFHLAGMRPADLVRLVESEIEGDEVYYVMYKTKVAVRWGINEKARALISKYRGKGVKYKGSRCVLPILREKDTVDEDAVTRRVNSFTARARVSLQVVAAAAGVPRFSIYVARHSANVDAILKDVSNRELQDMMGHKQSRNTDTYARRLRGSLSRSAFQKVNKG